MAHQEEEHPHDGKQRAYRKEGGDEMVDVLLCQRGR